MEPKQSRILTVSAAGLFILAVIYTLKIGEQFFIPLFLAIFLHFIMRPVLLMLVRIRIPRTVAAFLILGTLFGAFSAAVFTLRDPAVRWINTVPETLEKIQDQFRRTSRQHSIEKTLKRVEQIAEAGTADKVPEVRIKEHTLGENILGWTTKTAASTGMVFALLFFLLAGWDDMVRKITRASGGSKPEHPAGEIVLKTEAMISRYFFTYALINTGLGLSIALVMALLKMPNPGLWGVLGGLANFVPYAGSLACLVIIGAAAFMEFSLSHAVWIPFTYWLLTTAESVFVTPLIMGRNFTVNPFFVVLSITFWGWLWGIAGVLLAVPMLMAFRIAWHSASAGK